MVIIYECLKCGTCCRNLLEEHKGLLLGTALTEKETKLFPFELVFPKIGIGMREPEQIILYQLNSNVCPHLNSSNQCRIYSKRPLVCQAFPQEIYPPTVSVKCPVIGSQLKVGEKAEVEYEEDENGTFLELQAASKLDKYIKNRSRKYMKKGMKIWEFDLRRKKWIER